MAIEVTRSDLSPSVGAPVVVTRKPDWLGRTIGLMVFLIGIGLLVAVFYWSIQLAAPPPAPQGQKLDVQKWSISFGVNVMRLFVSGLVASWIAGRGAQLYAAANRALSGD